VLEAAVRQALSDGYRGLFATGDMTWEFGPDRDFKKLPEYELALQELFFGDVPTWSDCVNVIKTRFQSVLFGALSMRTRRSVSTKRFRASIRTTKPQTCCWKYR